MMPSRLSLLAAATGWAGIAAAPCAAAAAAAADAQVQSAPEQFEINAFDVVGATRIDSLTIEKAVYPFAGPNRGAADVEAARKALEDAYKARGYESVLVEIPPQPNELFVAGVVTLKVNEAVVGRLRVVGSKYHAPTILIAQVPALQEGQLPDFHAAQAQIVAANSFPDRQVTPSIKGGAIPNTIDVDLKVEDELPLHGSLNLNNDHAAGTTALRLGASLRYTNLWQKGHTIGIGYQGSPQDLGESRVFLGSYTVPFADPNWSLLLSGYVSNSNVAAIGGTQVLGNGYDIAVRASYRLPGERVQQTVSFGLDYKDFKEDLTIPSGDPSVPSTTLETPIAYVPLTLSYGLQWASEASAFALGVGTTLGIRQLASDEDVIQTKRFNAAGNFVRVNLDLDYTRVLGADWLGVIRGAVQLADGPLVTNEQFSAGGALSVRGYYLAEAVGDNGATGTIELRTGSFSDRLGGRFDEMRLFAFTDFGYVRVLSPLPEQIPTETLVGAGAGLRFAVLRFLSGNLTFSRAMTDGTATQAGDIQFLFNVEAAF